MARIAIGGFQHETNTFALAGADLQDFLKGGGPLPPLARGGEVLDAVAGFNVPIAGFIDMARRRGDVLVPLLLAATMPSARVTARAFETIAGWLIDDLAAARPVDAVYLDLHGAMVSEQFEDSEGELLRRVRAKVGTDVPIVASLDYHANVTDAMIRQSDGLVAYRTYPHVDRADTGAKAALHLFELLEGGGERCKAYRQIPFLTPITSQCTEAEPTRSIIRAIESLENGDAGMISYTAGFPLADVRDCGPSVFGYGRTQAATDHAVNALYAEVIRREGEFVTSFYSPTNAVARAMSISETTHKPVVLADTQDNPGAGGTSDTVELLRALIEGGAKAAVFAIVCDPIMAIQAHEAGEGAEFVAQLGAKSGLANAMPYTGEFRVEKLTDGEFTGTGPMYKGIRMRLGRTALLRVGGVRVIVASHRAQAGDQSILRHVGLAPEAQRIIALKSSVHFRADFEPIAGDIMIVTAPGLNTADTRDIPYQNLRAGVRVAPMGKTSKGPPSRMICSGEMT